MSGTEFTVDSGDSVGQVAAALEAEGSEVLETSEVVSADAASIEQQDATAPVEPAAKPDDKFASKFAALTRKEKQLRTLEKSLQAQKKEFEDWKKAQEDGLKPYMSLKEKAAKDPSSILEDLRSMGLDEKSIIEKYILKPEPTAEEKQTSMFDELRKEIQALKAEKVQETELAKKRELELKQKTEERAKQNYLAHLSKFVEKSDDYELIRANDAVSMVYEVMEEHYNKTLESEGEGVVLSEKEAADLVEAHFLEQAKKLIETNKLKSVFQAKTPEPLKIQGKSQTLSNTSASQVPSKSEAYVSDDEARRRAASLIRFKS